METSCKPTRQFIKSDSQVIYEGLGKIDSSLRRLEKIESDAFSNLVDSIKCSDYRGTCVWVKEVKHIRILKNNFKVMRRKLNKFCEENQL